MRTELKKIKEEIIQGMLNARVRSFEMRSSGAICVVVDATVVALLKCVD